MNRLLVIFLVVTLSLSKGLASTATNAIDRMSSASGTITNIGNLSVTGTLTVNGQPVLTNAIGALATTGSVGIVSNLAATAWNTQALIIVRSAAGLTNSYFTTLTNAAASTQARDVIYLGEGFHNVATNGIILTNGQSIIGSHWSTCVITGSVADGDAANLPSIIRIGGTNAIMRGFSAYNYGGLANGTSVGTVLGNFTTDIPAANIRIEDCYFYGLTDTLRGKYAGTNFCRNTVFESDWDNVIPTTGGGSMGFTFENCVFNIRTNFCGTGQVQNNVTVAGVSSFVPYFRFANCRFSSGSSATNLTLLSHAGTPATSTGFSELVSCVFTSGLPVTNILLGSRAIMTDLGGNSYDMGLVFGTTGNLRFRQGDTTWQQLNASTGTVTRPLNTTTITTSGNITIGASGSITGNGGGLTNLPAQNLSFTNGTTQGTSVITNGVQTQTYTNGVLVSSANFALYQDTNIVITTDGNGQGVFYSSLISSIKIPTITPRLGSGSAILYFVVSTATNAATVEFRISDGSGGFDPHSAATFTNSVHFFR